jgi:hypothetical protein
VFKCVQGVDIALLSTVVNDVAAKAPLPSSIWPWQPVVDGTFIADFPSKLTAAGKFTKVPMIMGMFAIQDHEFKIATTDVLIQDSQPTK